MKNEPVANVLDETDLALLEQLQRNCRQTVAQLSEKVHLSSSACHRRIKALEEAGAITNYVAKLSSKKLVSWETPRLQRWSDGSTKKDGARTSRRRIGLPPTEVQ